MDVRTRILDAALGLLAEGGELTQPRVSKAAGVRQSHLTYYFPTITDLLQAVARHSFDKLAGHIDSVRRRRQDRKLNGPADRKQKRVVL